jgi:hypothetical protein
MTITKVSYGKTYNLGNYCSHRIDLEASIDEGEDIQYVLSSLKQQCDLFHTTNVPTSEIPHLYQETTQGITHYTQPHDGITQDQTIPQPKKLSQKELITQEVTNAKTLKALSEWKLLADKYPDLKELYDNQLQKLTNGL